jgi:hypothetical protein
MAQLCKPSAGEKRFTVVVSLKRVGCVVARMKAYLVLLLLIKRCEDTVMK